MGEKMKIYCTVTKSYALMLCVTLLICFSFLGSVSAEGGKISLKNEADRCSFISSCGFLEPVLQESKEVSIPLVFSKELEKYSSKMQKGGYSISEFKGNNATLYTYNFDKWIIHLLCLEERLLCADYYSIEDNKIYPLKVRKNG